MLLRFCSLKGRCAASWITSGTVSEEDRHLRSSSLRFLLLLKLTISGDIRVQSANDDKALELIWTVLEKAAHGVPIMMEHKFARCKMEMLLAITRAVVLVGSVLFAFSLFAAGFYITMREYRHVSSWPKLEQFIKLTAQEGVKADLIKGTVSMSRMRPGLLMMAIAAVILCVCITRPLKYESSSSSTPAAPVYVQPAQMPQTAADKVQAQATSMPIRELGVDDIRAFYWKMLDKWLPLADDLNGKPLPEWFRVLQSVTGENTVKFAQRYSAKGETPSSIAKVMYGDERYTPLIMSLNPSAATPTTPYPQYTLISILEPQVTTMPVVTSLKLEIAGQGREELYDHLCDMATAILSDPAYQNDQKAWFEAHGFVALLPMESFARGLDAQTGRQWSTQWYYTSPGETPALAAKSIYRATKYLPILRLANFDNTEVLEMLNHPDGPLPANTRWQTINLVTP
jgi:hypothetical protein